MPLSESWFQSIVIAITGLIGAGVIASLVNDAALTGHVSATQEGLRGVNQRLDDQVARLEAKIDSQIAHFDRLEANLTSEAQRIRQDLDKFALAFGESQNDLPKIIVGLGLARPDDVFTASVIDNAVWVFPGAELAERWQAEGRRLQPVSAALSGFRVYELSSLPLRSVE